MTGAFAQGFNIGRSVYQQALDNRDREQRRAAEDKERTQRMEATQLGIDAQRAAAARESQLATIRQGISDFATGTDRAASTQAMNADFDAAMAASEAGVKAENAARQGVLPAAAPAMPAMPAVRGGSNAANEAALTVRKPVNPASTEYRTGMNRLQAQYAVAAGDMVGARALDAEGRQITEDALFGGRLKEYTGTPEQIGSARVFLNQNSKRITMGTPGKNGLVSLSVVKPDGEADFMQLSRADQAKLYAAAGLMETNPVRALEVIGQVNQNLAAAVAADNNLTTLLAGNSNDVVVKGSTLETNAGNNRRADNRDRREDNQDRRAAEAATEALRAQEAQRRAAVALEQAIQSGDPAAIQAARLGVVRAGGSPGAAGSDGKVESEFRPDPSVEGGGWITQRQLDGTITVVKVDREGRPLKDPKDPTGLRQPLTIKGPRAFDGQPPPPVAPAPAPKPAAVPRPTARDIGDLVQRPQTAAEFDERFGAGAAQRALRAYEGFHLRRQVDRALDPQAPFVPEVARRAEQRQVERDVMRALPPFRGAP